MCAARELVAGVGGRAEGEPGQRAAGGGRGPPFPTRRAHSSASLCRSSQNWAVRFGLGVSLPRETCALDPRLMCRRPPVGTSHPAVSVFPCATAVAASASLPS